MRYSIIIALPSVLGFSLDTPQHWTPTTSRQRLPPAPLTTEGLIHSLHTSPCPVWSLIQFEGSDAADDLQASAMLHQLVISRHSLANAVTELIANKLDTPFLQSTEISLIMGEMFDDKPGLAIDIAEDLLAHANRDPSIPNALHVFLFHKGFHVLVAYRMAHWLWIHGRKELARYLQSMVSEIWAADIHPAARIGSGIMVSSGTDIVIGETAIVGDDVCLMQGVTLGGTGKERGDRHPKVGSGALIGVGASVLGNIPVGEGARVEAGSVVVKPVMPYSIVRGVPAKVAGFFVCDVDQCIPCGVETHRMCYIQYQARYLGL